MLIDLATAKAHLRVDGTDDDAMITLYIGAAERSAAEFIGRNIYVDQSALVAAIAGAPAALTAATVAYDAAILSASALDAGVELDMAILAANEAYSTAKAVARMTHQGIVINDQIKAAMLLTIGHLYANREDVVAGVPVAALPMGCGYLLQPFRSY